MQVGEGNRQVNHSFPVRDRTQHALPKILSQIPVYFNSIQLPAERKKICAFNDFFLSIGIVQHFHPMKYKHVLSIACWLKRKLTTWLSTLGLTATDLCTKFSLRKRRSPKTVSDWNLHLCRCESSKDTKDQKIKFSLHHKIAPSL